MTPTQLGSYTPCPSRTAYSYSTPIQQTVHGAPVSINSYSSIPNSIGK